MFIILCQNSQGIRPCPTNPVGVFENTAACDTLAGVLLDAVRTDADGADRLQPAIPPAGSPRDSAEGEAYVAACRTVFGVRGIGHATGCRTAKRRDRLCHHTGAGYGGGSASF